ENANLEVLESYGIEDQNIALLKYYYTIQSADSAYLEARTEDAIQPRWGALVKELIKGAAKKKQGPKIEKQIGKEVDAKVVKNMAEEAEILVEKYGYTKFVGPEGAGANGIRQGEFIFELYGYNNRLLMRGDVGITSSRNKTTWHWHQ